MKATWLETGEEISLEKLNQQGIFYEKISTENYQPALDRIKKEWSYSAQDIVELFPTLPNLDIICAKFDKEHIHTDDEVRFVLSGEGYFDIRSNEDVWMHIFVEMGDFILVPANRQHLFTLTEKKAIQCVRLFKENPSWTPIYRNSLTDDRHSHPVRHSRLPVRHSGESRNLANKLSLLDSGFRRNDEQGGGNDGQGGNDDHI